MSLSKCEYCGDIVDTDADPDCYYDEDGNDRTMQTAHNYIATNFETLQDGDVIDVEYILQETPEPKQSEKFTA